MTGVFIYILFRITYSVYIIYMVCVCLCGSVQSGWYRLPAMRMSVRFRLALADLGLMMLEMQCEEKKIQATIQSRMSSTERAVDDYLRSSSDLNALQRVIEQANHSSITTVLLYS